MCTSSCASGHSASAKLPRQITRPLGRSRIGGPVVWGQGPLDPGFRRHLLKCLKMGSSGARGRRQKLLARKDLPKRAVRPILSEG